MKRVGVIGGGQLAAMMGGAAHKLGVELVVQTPGANDPAVAIAQDTVFAPVDDAIVPAPHGDPVALLDEDSGAASIVPP